MVAASRPGFNGANTTPAGAADVVGKQVEGGAGEDQGNLAGPVAVGDQTSGGAITRGIEFEKLWGMPRITAAVASGAPRRIGHDCSDGETC
ncbi:MAG: hypothetical protein R2789_13235 [Microthrixaceae bacterium]